MDGSARTAELASTATPTATPAVQAVTTAQLTAGAFVLLWCTGYLAGKVGVAHAGAFTLLVWRFGGAALVFVVLAAAARAHWPGWSALKHSAVVGLLSLALQFGGVYAGLALGAGAGIAALVIGAMPLVTSALAAVTGERLRAAQWLGLGVGFAGVLAVLADRIDPSAAPWTAWLGLVLGLVGISTGTLYQKRYASGVDARVGLAVQHVVGAAALLPFAFAFEGLRADLSVPFFAATGWLVLVNSVGGFALLFVLLRRGAATDVAALFFLVPPVTAVLGWALLGEALTAWKLGGFALAALGVWLGTRTPPQRLHHAPGK